VHTGGYHNFCPSGKNANRVLFERTANKTAVHFGGLPFLYSYWNLVVPLLILRSKADKLTVTQHKGEMLYVQL
jgi:hypothetical protein